MTPDRDEPTDEELMSAYSAGDVAAFERLFQRHQRRLFTYLLHRTGSRALADDLFQESFLRVIRSRARYRPTGSFRSWLFTMAHNAMTDDRRRAALREAHGLDQDACDRSEAAGAQRQGLPAVGVAHDPVAVSNARDLREHIEAALLRIPVEQREVFLLRERGGLEFGHIAEVTGCGLATVKSRMRYALANLRRCLSDRLTSVPEVLHE